MFDALPRHLSFDEVANLAQDRKLWKMLTNCNGDAQAAANIIKTTPPTPKAVTPRRSPARTPPHPPAAQTTTWAQIFERARQQLSAMSLTNVKF